MSFDVDCASSLCMSNDDVERSVIARWLPTSRTRTWNLKSLHSELFICTGAIFDFTSTVSVEDQNLGRHGLCSSTLCEGGLSRPDLGSRSDTKAFLKKELEVRPTRGALHVFQCSPRLCQVEASVALRPTTMVTLIENTSAP